MKYNEEKCPKCGKILQVPEDLEKLTCMYCGKEIETKDMIPVYNEDESILKELESEIVRLWDDKDPKAIQKARALFEKDHFNYTANYILSLDTLPRILLENKGITKQFKTKLYATAIKEYMIASRPSLEYLERACVVRSDEKEDILEKSAKHFITAIKEDILHSKKNKSKISTLELDDYKMALVLFTIPMILELNLDISDKFADKIIEAWIEEFPKSIIKKGTFEHINAGFRKKGFCYITTAVCETLHKPDNCYELTMFRDFRDNYLLKQEDGKELVGEYYLVAPLIVEHINSFEERDKIYQEIWNNYLNGCLMSIESGDNEKCKEDYSKMVRELQMKYNI